MIGNAISAFSKRGALDYVLYPLSKVETNRVADSAVYAMKKSRSWDSKTVYSAEIKAHLVWQGETVMPLCNM